VVTVVDAVTALLNDFVNDGEPDAVSDREYDASDVDDTVRSREDESVTERVRDNRRFSSMRVGVTELEREIPLVADGLRDRELVLVRVWVVVRESVCVDVPE
jgi:hypothetical protein